MTDDQAQLIGAGGEGADVFDDPALFFLTFEDDIRKWYELRHRARTAAEEFLGTLPPDVAGVAPAADYETEVADTSGYRHILVSPMGTPRADDSTPVIVLCLGWHRDKFWMRPHTYTPFVGVRLGGSKPDSTLRPLFVDEHGRPKDTTYKTSNEWPAWRQVPAGKQWWADLDTYRSTVRDAFRATFDRFGADVARAAKLPR